MRIVLAASLLLLAGCSSHEKSATSTDPNVVLASSNGAGCHGGAAKAEMASMEGGKSCSAKTAEMASSDGAKSCASKTEMASTGAHACDGACPMKADGSCDHEAGAKAGRECCKGQLAKTATP